MLTLRIWLEQFIAHPILGFISCRKKRISEQAFFSYISIRQNEMFALEKIRVFPESLLL